MLKELKKNGDEYEMENFNIDDAKIKLVNVLAEIYLSERGNYKLSLFKDPRLVESNAKWYCKHLDKAFDSEFVFQLVENSKYKDKFDIQSDFGKLDNEILSKAMSNALDSFYKTLDCERNGYNHRNKKSNK